MAALLLTIVAPSKGMAEQEFRLTVGPGRHWFHQAALDGVVEQFLGGRPSGGGGFGAGGAATRGWTNAPSSIAAVGLVWQRPLLRWGGGGIHARIEAEAGHSRYRLKRGYGPFVEPIALQIGHVSVAPSIVADQQFWARSGKALTGEIGLGMEWIRARSVVTSPLLHVRRWESFDSPFAEAALRYEWPSGTSLKVGVRARPGQVAEIALSLESDF